MRTQFFLVHAKTRLHCGVESVGRREDESFVPIYTSGAVIEQPVWETTALLEILCSRGAVRDSCISLLLLESLVLKLLTASFEIHIDVRYD